MLIREFRVTNLFGLFDHIIPVRKRITIVHGPNGYGKTAMLRLLAATIEGNSLPFTKTPFESFRVSLADGRSVEISKVPTNEKRASKASERFPPHVSAELQAPGVSPRSLEFSRIDLPNEILDIIDTRIPGPYTRHRNGWIDRNTGAFLDLESMIATFGEGILPQDAKSYVARLTRSHETDATLVSSVFGGMKVHFIQTRRLDAPVLKDFPRRHYKGDDDVTNQLKVAEYSEDITARIRSVLAQYAKYSQQKDSTFPERLVDFIRQKHEPMPEGEILASLERLEQKRSDLTRIGFLDKEPGIRDLRGNEDIHRIREALHLYVSDVEDKLKVFDDLAARVTLFMDLVNAHFSYKRLSISREKGFVLTPTSHRGLGPLELADLSSGEQNELVVLYELLFRVSPNSLVLIDEPEISLHVEWQVRFLSDLEKILRAVDATAIVATHSPQIINHRWNDTIELVGPPRARADEIPKMDERV